MTLFQLHSQRAELTGPRWTPLTLSRDTAPATSLLSGWLEGEQVIAGRPAALVVRLGKGRVVLLGFPAQHRAQSHATFRLFFNSIFTSTRDQ